MPEPAPTRDPEGRAPQVPWGSFPTVSVMPHSSDTRVEKMDSMVVGGNFTQQQSNFYIQIDTNQTPSKERAPKLSSALVGLITAYFSRKRSGKGDFPAKKPAPSTSSGSKLPVMDEKEGPVRVSPAPSNTQQRNDDEATTPIVSHDVYARVMLSKGIGIPCWQPQPWVVPDVPAEARGTVLGDVGILTSGGFLKFFNLWKDMDMICSIAHGRTAAQCVGLKAESSKPRLRNRPNDVISSGVSTQMHVDDLFEPHNHSKFHFDFHCISSPGAILAMPTGADLEEVGRLPELEGYIRHHSAAIIYHANRIQQLGEGSSVYIVSSCLKSDSWAMAVYGQPISERADSLQLAYTTRSPGTSASSLLWTNRGMSEAQCDSVPAKDQTLFLNGFTIAFVPDILAEYTSKQADRDLSGPPGPSGTGPDKNEDGSDRHDHNSGSGQGGPSDGSSGQPPNSGGRGQSSSPESSDYVQSFSGVGSHLAGSDSADDSVGHREDPHRITVKPPSDVTTIVHPSDLINAYVIQQTGCKISICHDEAWCQILNALESGTDTPNFVQERDEMGWNATGREFQLGPTSTSGSANVANTVPEVPVSGTLSGPNSNKGSGVVPGNAVKQGTQKKKKLPQRPNTPGYSDTLHLGNHLNLGTSPHQCRLEALRSQEYLPRLPPSPSICASVLSISIPGGQDRSPNLYDQDDISSIEVRSSSPESIFTGDLLGLHRGDAYSNRPVRRCRSRRSRPSELDPAPPGALDHPPRASDEQGLVHSPNLRMSLPSFHYPHSASGRQSHHAQPPRRPGLPYSDQPLGVQEGYDSEPDHRSSGSAQEQHVAGPGAQSRLTAPMGNLNVGLSLGQRAPYPSSPTGQWHPTREEHVTGYFS